MPEITYAIVEPILKSVDTAGQAIVCEFACPKTGNVIKSEAHPQREGPGLIDRAKKRAKGRAMWKIRSSIISSVQKVCGRGILGSLAGSFAADATTNMGRTNTAEKKELTEEQKQAAVVEAFKKVQNKFVWDDDNTQWILADVVAKATAPFVKQLETNPVTEKYDQGVMARMLVEIAAADGDLESEEKLFVLEFIPEGMGTVDEVAAKAPLTNAELEETEESARDTMLMVAYAVALTDEDLEDEEIERLNQFAEGLAITEERAKEIKAMAQEYIIDQTLSELYGENAAESEITSAVNDLAPKIGMTAEEGHRALVQYKKRNDLF